MPSEQAKMDDNFRRALIAVTDDVNAFLKNLLVDPVTGRLKVTAIVTSGGGITSLNALTGGSQTFADVDDTNVTLTIASAGTTHTFTLGWSGQLAIARGGTGAATASAGFDALSPTTTEGDIIFRNATTNARLAKGTAGQVLTMNAGATAPEWQTPAAAPTNFNDSTFYVYDNGDATKRVAFQVSGVTASTTRTLTIQDADGTIYITGGTDVAVADGGTGASTAADARTNLGLAIGTNVQAYSALLAAIAGMTPTDGNIIVGDGATFVAESGATARTSLGLGTGDSPTFTAVSADTINEKTAANGVTIDGLKIKDSGFALGSDADGDIYYRASGALARLAKGTASQVLRMNSGATAPEWATPTSPAEFGGNGQDGVLNVTSGTTNINTGTYQYSSVSVSSGATLSTASTSGILHLLCQGNMTITGTIGLNSKNTSATVAATVTLVGGSTFVPTGKKGGAGAGGGGGSGDYGTGTATGGAGGPGNGGGAGGNGGTYNGTIGTGGASTGGSATLGTGGNGSSGSGTQVGGTGGHSAGGGGATASGGTGAGGAGSSMGSGGSGGTTGYGGNGNNGDGCGGGAGGDGGSGGIDLNVNCLGNFDGTSGTINTSGGTGGTGGNGGSVAGAGGGGGGGGGGSGGDAGKIRIIYDGTYAAPTFTQTAGGAGTGGTKGSTGSGTAATNGSNGSAGSAGSNSAAEKTPLYF